MGFVGIEIGGTKLQMGIGAGDGELKALWRGAVDTKAGVEGIRQRLMEGWHELRRHKAVDAAALRGAGIGFGGPVDAKAQTIIRSFQIDGWEGFALAEWVGRLLGLPAVLGNDADVAGLGEARYGAGKGLSPVFYVTVGSGVGGGLIIDGKIYPGCGRGSAEIGHLQIAGESDGKVIWQVLEKWASGWAIQQFVREKLRGGAKSVVLQMAGGEIDKVTTKEIADAARAGDELALLALARAWDAIAAGLCHVIALLCPRKIIIGGGVSLMGETLFFEPVRARVAQRVFQPFAGLTQIVPAQLGEAVVVHGAVALASDTFGGGK